MQHADRSFDVARLTRQRCDQIAMDANDCLYIGATTGELQDIAPAEAKTNSCLSVKITNPTCVGFPPQGFQRTSDSPAALACICTYSIGKGCRFVWPTRNLAAAVHVGQECYVLSSRYFGRALDRVLANA